eukprot:2210160-Rhodomonas_salina.3
MPECVLVQVRPHPDPENCCAAESSGVLQHATRCGLSLRARCLVVVISPTQPRPATSSRCEPALTSTACSAQCDLARRIPIRPSPCHFLGVSLTTRQLPCPPTKSSIRTILTMSADLLSAAPSTAAFTAESPFSSTSLCVTGPISSRRSPALSPASAAGDPCITSSTHANSPSISPSSSSSHSSPSSSPDSDGATVTTCPGAARCGVQLRSGDICELLGLCASC